MQDGITAVAKSAYHGLRQMGLRLRNLAPSLPVTRQGCPLLHLGSRYGGWTCVASETLQNATVVSCGLGEDASFDVAFAAHYGARVILVDPTPRAVQHFHGLVARLGEPPRQPYAKGGKQPLDAYDLEQIKPGQLQLCAKALWSQSGRLKFFAPPNPAHVSHSISNYQNNYATDTAHIMVDALTIDQLLAAFAIGALPLLKLDIEGAEIEVLADMLAKGIHPQQVLVEYDELSVPSQRSKLRIEETHAQLLSTGYRLVYRRHNNATYFRQR